MLEGKAVGRKLFDALGELAIERLLSQAADDDKYPELAHVLLPENIAGQFHALPRQVPSGI